MECVKSVLKKTGAKAFKHQAVAVKFIGSSDWVNKGVISDTAKVDSLVIWCAMNIAASGWR